MPLINAARSLPTLSSLTVADQEKEKQKHAILTRHPLIEIFESEWIKFLDCYEGGISFTKNSSISGLGHKSNVREYLRRHKREKTHDFETRKMRTHYANYCRPAIEFWVSAIYRDEQMRRAEDNEAVAVFWNDVDGCGTTIQEFMREKVAVIGQIFGWCAVLLDTPNPPELASKSEISEADVRRFGIKPRARVISPLDIITWHVNVAGEFDFFRYKERSFDNWGQESITIKTWTPEFWALHDTDGELITRSDHAFGIVPIVLHQNQESMKYDVVGESAIKDIADININIFNMTSLIDEFAYDAAFPILYMEMRHEEVQLIKELGLNRALGIPQGGGTPGFLSPPTEPYTFLINYISYLVREINRIAVIDNEPRKMDAIDRRSGVKTEIDKNISDSLLAKKASRLERTEKKIVEFVTRIATSNDEERVITLLDEVEIKYNKRFDFKILKDELMELMQIGQLMPESENLVKHKKIGIVKKMVQDPELRLLIEKELNGSVPELMPQQEEGRQGVPTDQRHLLRDN